MEINIVDQILDLPNAGAIVEEVKEELAREKKARLEFYEWVTPDIKAEFINGEIVIHSPVNKRHNTSQGNIYRLMDDYAYINDLGEVFFEKIMIRLKRNDYEPDVLFFDKDTAAAFDDDHTLFPAPNLIVEVLSKGTQARDRGIKFEDYALNGVQEYWIVDAKRQFIEQYELRNERYQLRQKYTVDQTIQSVVIEGFQFKVAAAFDKKAYLAARKALGI